MQISFFRESYPRFLLVDEVQFVKVRVTHHASICLVIVLRSFALLDVRSLLCPVGSR